MDNASQDLEQIFRKSITVKRVLIGTPCYDGRLDVWYTNSLINTIKQSTKHNIEIIPMWVSFDALIQRARNDTIQIAIDGDYDDLVWIDSDIEWQPDWFFKLLDYPHDVVGGTYRKKGDREEYVVRQLIRKQLDPVTGLIEVDGLGTGFVKMSKRAIRYLWDNAETYIDPKDMRERRMIFNVVIENQSMISEDIHAFNTLQKGGFTCYLDPKIVCNHIGAYKFKSSSEDYLRWSNLTMPQNKKRQL